MSYAHTPTNVAFGLIMHFADLTKHDAIIAGAKQALTTRAARMELLLAKNLAALINVPC